MGFYAFKKWFFDVSRLYLDVNGNFYVLTGLSIDILERKKNGNMNLTYVDKYMIQGHKDDLSISIEVSDHHEMILNDFMDYAGKYGKKIQFIWHNYCEEMSYNQYPEQWISMF